MLQNANKYHPKRLVTDSGVFTGYAVSRKPSLGPMRKQWLLIGCGLKIASGMGVSDVVD